MRVDAPRTGSADHPPSVPTYTPQSMHGKPELAAALGKAQGMYGGAAKSGENKHLGNRYTELSDVCDALREPFAQNGLSHSQTFGMAGDNLVMTTWLMHESGQSISSEMKLAIKEQKGMNFYQTLGSAITYLRRYCLLAISGLAPADDDDGIATGPKLPTVAEIRELDKKVRAAVASASPHTIDTVVREHQSDLWLIQAKKPEWHSEIMEEVTKVQTGEGLR